MAQAKITELTELTSAVASDVLPIVDDPGGSPVTKKITVANLLANTSAGAYNVMDYGATGDGVTDDTAALQAAIDAASGVTPAGRVVLPAGVYAISDPLTISTSGVALLGVAGWGQATILCTTADSGIVVDKGGGAITYQVEIGNLYISGDSVAATGLTLINSNESSFHDITIINTTTYGLLLQGEFSGLNSLDRILLNGTVIGVRIEAGGTCWFRACNFYDLTTVFSFTGITYNIHIRDSWFETFTTAFLWDCTSANITINSLHVRDCYFISTAGGGAFDCRVLKTVAANNTYNNVVRDVQISGCHFSTTAAKYLIEVAWSTYVGGGTNRFFATLRDNYWHISTNATAWLKTPVTEASYEYVRVIIDNPMHSGTAVALQDGTERGLAVGLRPYSAAAAPAAGPWLQGDIVWNNDPDAGDFIGWVCTTAGSPGTWLGFGAIETP